MRKEVKPCVVKLKASTVAAIMVVGAGVITAAIAAAAAVDIPASSELFGPEMKRSPGSRNIWKTCRQKPRLWKNTLQR